MDYSKLFKNAHQLARKTQRDGFVYHATFTACLKFLYELNAYIETKAITPLLPQIKKIGKLWEKAGYKRYYFNDLISFVGFEYENRRNGNLWWATLHGASVSNNYAKRAMSLLKYGKFYYDVESQDFGHDGLNEDLFEMLKREVLIESIL